MFAVDRVLKAGRIFYLFLSICWFLTVQNTFAQGKTDLVFIVDGSGSISSADFRLQKDGIIAALQNPLIFPRNGNIAVALVQFSTSSGSNATRVEVLLTTIDDDSDVTNLVAQVDAIIQIGQLTNPGDGINAAVAVLVARGMSKAIFTCVY